MIIAALKWTIFTIVFVGKDRTKWGGLESSIYTLDADGKIF